jgi:transposase
MKRKKPMYTREFKLAILSQVNAGIPVAQVARENGLHPQLVFRWKKEYLENPEKAFSGPGNPYKDQAKIAELERTVGRLYSENEFLKKTLESMKNHAEEEKRKSKLRRDTK